MVLGGMGWGGVGLRWKSVWRSFVACVIEAAPQKDDKLLENYVHKHTSVNKLGNRKFMFNNLMLFSLAKDSLVRVFRIYTFMACH